MLGISERFTMQQEQCKEAGGGTQKGKEESYVVRICKSEGQTEYTFNFDFVSSIQIKENMHGLTLSPCQNMDFKFLEDWLWDVTTII